ncbi:UDP-N-acetylmuramate--L-alanine ligase [Thermophagus xiamenensis]|uniref:UDP-N-acetylmuramate: L-alanyl-gamma-D-glutamyl-meso-diaminopimelate ligase n=1 Tax=Thermophagus xiamenensis TaxID=385682 RepID=A0A1I1UUQ4_9BACT|nr:Mur ligase family protein [Thermophagus xiamenensis]SFD74507.1 UDP-N-acetylmuramate: L-alanyl-gamma-D-glutamyl-meso-diaminopimelate ligase [Thermophagus xiamenensis]
MRVHFIAIGGSAMHNLAIALHQKGFVVSGSDDQVFEPSRSRLQKYGLLPSIEGWNPDRITEDIDAVIVGMHARPDNPELLKAQMLGIKIYSYPEYLFEQTRQKKRVVIAGSHGKTTITSMLLHVMKVLGKKVDFMVGARLKGFETMVHLSDDSDIAIFEGDEYLSSPIDRRPKFLWYQPHIALISGIAWDHINVFPTIEEYNQQFERFVQTIQPGGTLFYYGGDPTLRNIAQSLNSTETVAYDALEAKTEQGKTIVHYGKNKYELKIFGQHNLQNLSGALLVAQKTGIAPTDFLEAMQSFEGASRRLQILAENKDATVFFDFAHAPSKVKATVAAVKEQYPHRHLTAVAELHTFSSLNRKFLPQYKDTLMAADNAVIFYNPEVIKHKKLPPITPDDVKAAFGSPRLRIITNATELETFLTQLKPLNGNLLVMSSGNLGGINLRSIASQII